MTNRRNRLGRLERIADLELEARARAVLGFDGDSVAWTEIGREYREVSARWAAICELPQEHGNRVVDIKPQVRALAQDLDLAFEELIAEAEGIAARGSLDPQAMRWLLSRLG
jgi:hypothetical protein